MPCIFPTGASDAVCHGGRRPSRILWTYRAGIDPKSGNPIGKSSRGVAMGEGKIFIGQIDAKLVALDQRTGKVLWSVQELPWQEVVQPSPARRFTTPAWSSPG